MKKTALASTLTVLLLLGCLLAVGCDSLDGTTTTVLGGGSGTGDTSAAGTATTLRSTATTLPIGGTPITGESGNTILGKWHNSITGETLEFLPNGTVLGTAGDRMGATVTYAINVDQLTISALGTILVTQTFSIDGNTLTIIDNETGVSGTLQRVN